MIVILLLLLTIVFSLGRNTSMRYFGEKINGGIERFLFNGVACMISAFICLCLGKFSLQMDFHGLVCGLFLGVLVFVEAYLFTVCMKSGNMAIMTILGCISTVVPMITGVVFLNDPISPVKIIGTVLLFGSLAMTVFVKKNGAKVTALWLIFAVLKSVCGALMGLTQQEFLKNVFVKSLKMVNEPMSQLYQFIFVAMVTAGVGFLLTALYLGAVKKEPMPYIKNNFRLALLGMVIFGAGTAVMHTVNVQVLSMIPSVIFFPAYNGTVIVLTGVIALVVFKEKMNLVQKIGYLLGTVSVLMVAGVFG